ncbi:MAG: CBS domain-containing protein [Gammaproteobacteria bacterium]|nr:CBS domain-containing protein [Gammaproteobacteria bacterium]
MKNTVLEQEICPTAASCNIIIPSGVARSGMTTGEVISECIAARLPGIPFLNEQDRIVGGVTVKRIMVTSCIPADVRKHAHLLGDYLENINISIDKLKEITTRPIETFVDPEVVCAGSNSPIVKLLALMNKSDKSYVFIVDEGKYLGAVSIHGIARHVMEHIETDKG